ncbi:MAG: hypothetical protein QXK37_01930, partial [Candidatus Woesearchaeota archaeon]
MLVTKIKETRSICPVCFKEIDAVVVEKSNAVYIKKRCSSHGVFFSLLEKNADFYKKLMTTKYNLNKENKKSYKSFMFPLTSDCNMNCDFCYNPKKQKPMKITEVISFIR